MISLMSGLPKDHTTLVDGSAGSGKTLSHGVSGQGSQKV